TEECFILLNHDLQIVSFNRQFQQLYARFLGKDVAKGDCILDYAEPERRAIVKEMYMRVLQGTEEYRESRIPLPDASEKNFAVKYKPAKDEQGEIIGAFVSVIDITEKKKMEKLQEFEKRDKEALINTTEDLIWTVGSDFKLIAANHAFLNGIKKKSGIALSPGDDLMHNAGHTPEFLKLWEGLYNRALAGNSFIEEMYTPSSELYPESWAETRFNPIYDGNMITGIACYRRDTTASRSFQNRLMDINKKLENAQQTAQLGYWELSMDRSTLHWSGEVYKIWGVAEETFHPNYAGFLASIHPDDRELFDNSQKNAFGGKGKLDVEHRIILADSTIKYVHEKGELIYNDQGNPIHFEGTVQDITERKKTEAILIKRDNQLTLAAEMARLGYWEQDIINGIFTFTDEFYAIFKTTAEKVGGYTMSAARYAELFVHPDDRDLVAKLVAESIKSSDASFSFKAEHRIIYATGEIGHISVQFYIVKDDRGRTIKNFGVNQDITERKKAEEEIKEINQRFKYVTKATSDAIWDWDLLNQTIYWGEGFETIFGYRLDGIKTDISSWTDHIHPQDFDRVMKKVLAFIDGTEMKWEDQYRYCRQDQSYAHVVDRGFIIRDAEGKATRMVGSLRDITKKKNEEFALQQSEARHQGIIASQTNYVIRTDLVGNYTYYNQKFLDDFGWLYQDTNLIGMSCMESNMEYHRQIVIDTVEKCFANMNQVFQVEIDKPKKNGGIITTIWDFICLTDSGGQPTEIQCMGIDISERKKAQLALIDTLNEKNTILESIGDAFFAVDKNWIVTYWNSKAETMLGKTKTEVVGNHLWEVFSDSIDSESDRKYRQALQSGQVVQFEDYYPAQSKWYEISAYPSDSGLSVYFKDISERKFSEIQLTDLNGNIRKNAKKLAESNAELEQFAYVASHDLQEPLRMVTSYLSQIEKKYGGVIDDKGKKYIHFAVDGAKRMRQIILDLLEFSRVGRTDDDLENIDLNELIREIQILYIKQIKEKNATLAFDSLPVMRAHRSPLRQVFQNIIGNALKYTKKDIPAHICITAQELQNHWQFAITDNGIGIDKEYFDKIFVIFQRLHHKDEYSGTGIGLAVTKKIIENLGGRIWVESTEGEGSTFFFTLSKQT
ncbi:MAG TPA: PAS domain S-box protein, partial [Puia sp.]|nr:PAS domain S-box protein [Puia sp.]